MKRSTLGTLAIAFALAAPLAGQVEPAGVHVGLPSVEPVEAEDAAASVAAEMVQSILSGADEGTAWDELATVLEERGMARPRPASSGDGATGVAAEWRGFRAILRGEATWTLEAGLIVMIGFLLLVAALSTSVAFVRRRAAGRRPRIRVRRGRAPAASDAVRLAERLEARRV